MGCKKDTKRKLFLLKEILNSKIFKKAKKFVNSVGDLAEEQNHHPDISFGWGYFFRGAK